MQVRLMLALIKKCVKLQFNSNARCFKILEVFLGSDFPIPAYFELSTSRNDLQRFHGGRTCNGGSTTTTHRGAKSV